MIVFFNTDTAYTTNGAGTAYPSGAPEFNPGFLVEFVQGIVTPLYNLSNLKVNFRYTRY
jgi:hypothetical protein